MIDSGKMILVLRVNNYKNYSFVKEHVEHIRNHGYVWMLKVGRKLSDKTLPKVIDDGGFVILKEPKGSGGKYYLSQIVETYDGISKDDMLFPDYYKELSDDYPLSGTWLKLSYIKEIAKDNLPLFELTNKPKKMTEVIGITRSPILFVHSTKDIDEERLLK